jgi:tRNA(Met) C34 N-acetyltransferase TmcA
MNFKYKEVIKPLSKNTSKILPDSEFNLKSLLINWLVDRKRSISPAIFILVISTLLKLQELIAKKGQYAWLFDADNYQLEVKNN